MEYIYATLTLNELDQELNQENITAVLEAAGCDVIESRVKAIVAALEDVDIDDIGTEAGIAPAPSPAVDDDAEDASVDGDESAETEIADAESDESADTGVANADSDASDAVDADSAETDEPLEADAGAAGGETGTPEPSTASSESGSGDGVDEVSATGTADPGTESADNSLETGGGASNDESGAE